jgi:hypothetical protein
MRSAILGMLLAVSVLDALAQTSVPIHVTIVMHSEQTAAYQNNPVLFETSRTNLYRFASLLTQHGVMFNFQSDWTFLAAVTNFDAAGRVETGGTNIIAWMERDLGFEIDPHNHINQSIYTYADVAALIAACGATPTPVAGGFIAWPPASNELHVFQGTLTGAVHTAVTWRAGTLWGGASHGHRNETNLWFSGVYSPRDGTNWWQHQDDNLPLVGGYGGREVAWTNLARLLAMRTAGQLCTGTLYSCNIMVNMSELNAPFILAFDAQLRSYTNEPNLRWVGINQLTNLWAAEYAQRAAYLPWSPTNDLDADGLVDGWELTNFCGIAASDGSLDFDADGQIDADEYGAGTSPTNDADFFALVDGNERVITWRTVPGRTYIVDADAGAGWTPVHTATAVGVWRSWTNPLPATHIWHRVRVQP